MLREKGKSGVGVSFYQLNCSGDAASKTHLLTFATYPLALPKLLISAFSSQKRERAWILRDIEGIIRPGEMLLVLGRPGSGCSTFLKTLVGHTRGFHVAPESKFNYQGTSFEQMHNMCRGDRVYLAELDVHFPELTLGQTLGFAASMRENQSPKSKAWDTVLKFGLDASFETRVGNILQRGISGGEKRRVSIAEASLGGARLQALDNTTRGLDSSSAYKLIRLYRDDAKERNAAVAMSLYQASEDIYKSFDKVMILYEGRQIYFGPIDSAVEYFTNLGFVRPESVTTADFLTSVTSPAERRVAPGYEASAPRLADELANVWRQSEQRKQVVMEILGFNAAHPISDFDSDTTGFSPLSVSKQVQACFGRATRRLRNSPGPSISAVVANMILGLIIGSVFHNTGDGSESLQQRAILIFFSLTVNAFAPAFELALMWAQRPVVEKHHRYAFYHPFTERLASLLVDLPTKLIISFGCHIPLYFISGLRRTPSAFFTYWLFMFVNMLTMSMFFRFAGSVSRTQEQTLVPVSIVTVLCIMYTGFVLPPSYMVPVLAWFWRVNPLAYTYESLMINELDGRSFTCSTTLPGGPAYSSVDSSNKICPAIGSAVGQEGIEGSTYLELRYGYVRSHLWRNFGILCAMMLLFCISHLVAAEYVFTQPSRGEVLLFKRDETRRKSLGQDLESSAAEIDHDGSTPRPDEGVNRQCELHPKPTFKISRRPAVIHWQSLCFDIKSRKSQRAILKGVDGWIKPGTLTALMGVTGAGKTTLLDVLAQRTKIGVVSGDVLVNGLPRDASFQRHVGYVQQDDVHLPTATVREALQFSALLRQPASVSKDEKLAYTEDIIRLLNMGHYSTAVIGVAGEGLNVEQRKTLSIAIEMVAKPEFLLFLDEPTSGLDSQTAWAICTLLRKLASSGQTILCTIHQPSSQLFYMFENLLLLGRNGEPLYFGEIGDRGSSVIRYFEGKGAHKCPDNANPAEWMLKVTEEDTNTGMTKDDRTSWYSKWHSSDERQRVQHEMTKLRAQSGPPTEPVAARSDEEYALPILLQIPLLCKRMFRDQWREPVTLYCKIGLCILQALVNGISFYQSPHDVQGLISLLFSIFLMAQMFSSVTRLVTIRFIAGRDLFESRERSSKMYHWAAFISANIMVEAACYTLVSVPVFVCWYYMTGLYLDGTADSAGLAFILIWLFILWSATLCQAFAAGLPQGEMAVQIATLCFWLSIVFGGILVSPNNFPRFWIFMYYLSPLTHFFEGLSVASIAGIAIQCSSIELLQLPIPDNWMTQSRVLTCGEYLKQHIADTHGYLTNPSATADCQFCPVSDSDSVLRDLGLNVQYSWRGAGILAVYTVFNILVTFGVFWLVRVPREKKIKEV